MLDTDRLIDEFHQYIERAITPLNARIKELESKLQEKFDLQASIVSAVSEHLKANPPKDADPVLVPDVVAELIKSDSLTPLIDLYVEERVAKHFEANPIQHGKDGLNATPEQIAEAASSWLKANPPKDGQSITVEDVSVFMDAAISKWALDFERRANDKMDKAIERIPEPKAGRDGVAMPVVEYDGKRTITVKAQSGEIIQVCKLEVPMDAGYWKEGMEAGKGDIVTHDGNAWIAKKDNSSKPSHENKEDWRLFARKGRDGRDFTDKPPTAPVKL